jgi:hypothetical protein
MNGEQQRPTDARYYETVSQGMDYGVADLLLNMTQAINLLEHYLKGERFFVEKDEAGNMIQSWQPTGVKVMNDEGTTQMIMTLQLYLNQNTFLTVLDDEDIERIMTRLHMRLLGQILDRQTEYEIQTAYIRPVVGNITDVIWMALKRSFHSKTLDAFTKTYKAVETHESPRKRRAWFW